jgi:hypothetical protein
MAADPLECRNCKRPARTLEALLADIDALTRCVRGPYAPPATPEGETTARRTIAAKLTRIQFELSGYCYPCAFKGELVSTGEQPGMGRASHA